MKKSKLSYVVLIFGLLIPVLGAAAPFSNIYVLGDSLSDQGNLYAATLPGGPGSVPCLDPSQPSCQALVQANTGAPANDHYYQGRFSNGPIYADILAQQLGLSLTPSSSGGNNFAYGGARTNYNRAEITAPRPDHGYYPQGGAPWSLNLERQAFQARNINDPNGLYVVWSGANDLGDLIPMAIGDALNGTDNVAAPLNNVVQGIQSVINDFITAGAQHILVPNIPDLGLVPLVFSGNPSIVATTATSLTSRFNTLLDTMLDTFTGVNISRVDTFSMLQQIVADPSRYGFTNANTACYSGFVAPAIPPNSVTVCLTPSSYVFWDSEHLTTAFNALLADRFYQAVVPEPSVLMNFLLGLVVLTAVERTRLLRRHRAVECVS